jgi:ATP-dependent DNA helicase RecQ
MHLPKDILLKYWGYQSFRPLQEDIINQVLEGKDTLALLPTGGGKSICFQVPSMCMEGICIVVSPLIALMKDQVYHLEAKGIKATAIYSGMSKRLIDQTLDNCIYGEVKFLYVSPERLLTDIFIARVIKMKVNLWAIDEAHCISQWGYDFRPPYLQIADIREHHPDIPILALSATATPKVVVDIQEKLNFKLPNLLQKSFLRSNLSYSVLYEDAKYAKLVDILQKVKGSSVVYVRNRRKTKEISDYLNQCKISATHYHAGLSMDERTLKQENWIRNKTRVMVSTNAFGMGIDKPDVRTVIHMDMPESPEAYFQEAGRAGRDEKRAYAVLLFNLADKMNALDQLEQTMPSIAEIKNVYNATGNFLQLAIGSGLEGVFKFDLAAFCRQYNFNPTKTVHAFKFLEQQEYLLLSEGVYQSSKLMVKAHKDMLYKFMVENKGFEPLIKFILRSYSGLFDGLSKIDEKQIAKTLHTDKAKVEKALTYLDQLEIVQYERANDFPFLKFLKPRKAPINLDLDVKFIETRIAVFKEKLNSILHYATDKSQCRSNVLLSYFGEIREDRCGVCDFCLGRNKLDLNNVEYQHFLDLIREAINEEEHSLEYLMTIIPNQNKDKVAHFLKWLVDYEILKKAENGKYFWNEKR